MKDLNTVVTEEMLCGYLTAQHGEFLGLYSDGSYAVGQDVGREIAEDERPVLRVRVPGLGNLDMAEFAEDFAEQGEDGVWVDAEGRRYTDADLIRSACEDGDVEAMRLDLVARLEEIG